MLMIPNTQQKCGKEKVAILHQSESSWWHLPCQWEVKKKKKVQERKKLLYPQSFLKPPSHFQTHVCLV